MTKKQTGGKRAEAFQLFAQGETPKSASVKALGLTTSTRYGYYSEWKKLGSPGLSEISMEEDLKPQGRAVSELQMLVPSKPEPEEVEPPEDESRENQEETPNTEQGENQEEKKVPESEQEEKKYRGPDGKKQIPTMIAGQGLTFAVTLSTKTLALYQIAASMQKDELTLGDFLDACVEDTYRGRGLDLGLVRIGGNKENG